MKIVWWSICHVFFIKTPYNLRINFTTKSNGWVKKKYTRLMSHKKVTITSMLKNWLGLDNRSPKLDHDFITNHFQYLSIRLLKLKQAASLWKLVKIGQDGVLILALYSIAKNVSIQFFFFFRIIPLLKFDRQSLSTRGQSLSSRAIAIFESSKWFTASVTKKC